VRRGNSIAANTVVWLLKPVALVFSFAYRIANLLFGLDRRAEKRNLQSLIRELERDYSFLFFPVGARVILEQSSGARTMDFATVVLELPSILLRASRDRGFIDWDLSLKSSDSPWEPLNRIVQKLQPDGSITLRDVIEKRLPEIEQHLHADCLGCRC
jgi:hypothetical protein